MLFQMLQQVLKLLLKILAQQSQVLAGQARILQGQKAINQSLQTIAANQQVLLDEVATDDTILQKILAEVSPPQPGPLVALQIEYGTPEAVQS